MPKFKPTWVVCLLRTDSFKYECKVSHDVLVDGKMHKMSNTYRFTGRPLLYLIKDEEDYNEIIANPNFEDYELPEEKPVSAPSETTKQRKLRKRAEAKAAKEKAKKLKEDEKKELKPVPAEQTDGADTITERPESDSEAPGEE